MEQLNRTFFSVRKQHPPTLPEGIINEDLWLSYKIGREGFEHIPEARAFANAPSTLKDYFEQHVRWNTGLLQMREERGRFTKPSKRTALNRLRRARALSLYERFLLIPALAIDLYAALAARKTLREGKFKEGWSLRAVVRCKLPTCSK